MSIRMRYVVTAEYEDSRKHTETVQFPQLAWFCITFLMLVPSGKSVKLRDGATATVIRPP